jgi:ABC-2 type transport system ATP-binding protein
MALIELRKLTKSYRVYQKREGLMASLRGLFRREYREVLAVRGIDLDVIKANSWLSWAPTAQVRRRR